MERMNESKNVIIPAGWDHHNHPFLYHLLGKGIDISGTETKDEALVKIGDSLESVTSEVIVTGWTDAKFNITQEDLDKLGERPIIVFDTSFHGARVNTPAEHYLAFPEGTPGVLGNGMTVEQTIYPIFDRLSLTVEENKTGLLAMQQEYFSQGIVGVDEMFVNSVEQVQAYDELLRSGELKLKMKLWFRPWLIEQLITADRRDLLHYCEGVKLMLDGAFGVRTAALDEPYTDDPGNLGMLLMTMDELDQEVFWALEQGVTTVAAHYGQIRRSGAMRTAELGVTTVAAHCIGERAIDTALTIYRSFSESAWCAYHGIAVQGWRLEHAELITKEQAMIAKELGIVLSMQPNFGPDECVRFRDRLGDRVYRLNPFRMLIDEVGFVPGEDLIFGSDGMPTGYLHGLRCAVNSFTPTQSVTLQEAIRAYAAYDDAYDPEITFADLIRCGNYVVLDGDPLDSETKVLETFVDGQEVYSAS